MEKPTIDEVLKYVKPIVKKLISENAFDLPFEIQEEIEQSAYMRMVEVYPRIDADAGWKSFVYNHSRGAVLDYLKFGRGFLEGNWRANKPAADGSYREKLRDRIQLMNSDGEDVDAEFVAGINGVFSELDDELPNIRWDLLSHMASSDQAIHCFAKWLRGFQVGEIAEALELCRARVGQLLQVVIDRFDDPEWADDPWFKQMCYALGVCRHMGLPDVDQSQVLGFSVGWSEPAVDLDLRKPHSDDVRQMSFFNDVG